MSEIQGVFDKLLALAPDASDAEKETAYDRFSEIKRAFDFDKIRLKRNCEKARSLVLKRITKCPTTELKDMIKNVTAIDYGYESADYLMHRYATFVMGKLSLTISQTGDRETPSSYIRLCVDDSEVEIEIASDNEVEYDKDDFNDVYQNLGLESTSCDDFYEFVRDFDNF